MSTAIMYTMISPHNQSYFFLNILKADCPAFIPKLLEIAIYNKFW